MGEVAMDHMQDNDNDKLHEVRTKTSQDGEDFKQPQLASTEPTNENASDICDTIEDAEWEAQKCQSR
jgi:hypothetical protein